MKLKLVARLNLKYFRIVKIFLFFRNRNSIFYQYIYKYIYIIFVYYLFKEVLKAYEAKE